MRYGEGLGNVKDCFTTYDGTAAYLMKKISAEDGKLVRRMSFLRNLLKEFEATLHGYDPGVSFYIKNGMRMALRPHAMAPQKPEQVWKVFHADGADWAWLEPLLVELRAFRRQTKKKPAHKHKWSPWSIGTRLGWWMRWCGCGKTVERRWKG